MAADLADLSRALQRSKSAALILGAGISMDAGIPSGYRLMMDFGRSHPALTADPVLSGSWALANADRTQQRPFVDALVTMAKSDMAVEDALIQWLRRYPPMAGGHSDDHAVLVLLWLRRVFKHLVTTNWDRLLEAQIEALYDASYDDPFAPAELALSDGTSGRVAAKQLFAPDESDEPEAFWSPRWDIVASESDLPELRRWSRPVWKIHGSPFFLACPECRGFNRWKHEWLGRVGARCPVHPTATLRAEIIFWGDRVDVPYPKVWRRLCRRLSSADLVLVCGLSGEDTYIRDEVQRHSNSWVVNPTQDQWDPKRVRWIPLKGGDLTRELRATFRLA